LRLLREIERTKGAAKLSISRTIQLLRRRPKSIRNDTPDFRNCSFSLATVSFGSHEEGESG
jgi:hypothetical protein